MNNRWGIQKVIQMAFEKFLESAQTQLKDEDFERYLKENSEKGFVAHTVPVTAWEAILGFNPDPNFYSEITIGLAVEPDQPLDLMAKILISRDKDCSFIHILWKPTS